MDATPEILVAAGNPAHAEQLVRTAGDLARARGGGIRLVGVVVKARGSPFELFSDDRIIAEFSGDREELLARATATAPDDVPVTSELVVAASVADGVVEAAGDPRVEALVMGWHGPPRRAEVVLGSSVDVVLRRAPCDVFVERIGRTADGVDAVLLPVAGGPHVRPAVQVAHAVAAANDARVTVASVATASHDATTAADHVDEAEAALAAVAREDPGDRSVPVDGVVRRGDDVADAVVAIAGDVDVVVLGASRRGELRRRLLGSVARRVVERTDRTVLLARAEDASTTHVGSLLERFLPGRQAG